MKAPFFFSLEMKQKTRGKPWRLSMAPFKLLVILNADMQYHIMYKLREKKMKTNVANATGEYEHVNAKDVQNKRETYGCDWRRDEDGLCFMFQGYLGK